MIFEQLVPESHSQYEIAAITHLLILQILNIDFPPLGYMPNMTDFYLK